MPIPVITSIISAISILAGSALGAWCSWIINNKMHKRKMEEEQNLIKDNRKYEEFYKTKEVCANANVIRLDICTAIFQSIRFLKYKEEINFTSLFPVNKNYPCAVSSLSDKYSLKELSYIYQFYGIIESVNYNITKNNNADSYELFKLAYEAVLRKIYGNNIDKVIEFNIDEMSYEDLYQNEYIKSGYKSILEQLNSICTEEIHIKNKRY